MPIHSGFGVNVRRYHSLFAEPTSRITPDSIDSAANGTRISPSHFSGFASLAGRIA